MSWELFVPDEKAKRRKRARKEAEAYLEEISDSHCHLFPSAQSPYPVDCGELGLVLMQFVNCTAPHPYTIPAHWEFTWWDNPLELIDLKKETE